MYSSNAKIISRIAADQDVVEVRSPLKLFEENKRRYIRLEISEPIQFTTLKSGSTEYHAAGESDDYSGSVLNLSAGGVLFATQTAVQEGAIILMRMSLEGVAPIDNVVGLVKRVEYDSEEWLVGVEFVSGDYITDYLSRAELDILPSSVTSFDDSVRKVLAKYISHRKTTEETK